MHSPRRHAANPAIGATRPSAHGAAAGTLRHVARRNGLPGLYAGLLSKLWQTVLTAAVQLMIYEQLAAALTRRIAPPRRK